MNRREDQLNEFYGRFVKNLGDIGRVRKAYEKTEEEYQAEKGYRFYKNYASFSSAKAQMKRKTKRWLLAK